MNLQAKIAVLKRKKWCLFWTILWMIMFIIFIISGEYTQVMIVMVIMYLIELRDDTADLKDAVKGFKEDLSFKIILNGYAITKDEDGSTEIEVTWDKTAETNSIQIDHKET